MSAELGPDDLDFDELVIRARRTVHASAGAATAYALIAVAVKLNELTAPHVHDYPETR